MDDGTNAKEEFLEEIGKMKVVCAKIGIDKNDHGRSITWFTLKEKYSKEEFEQFLKELDFEYDSGYGSQELFGNILFKNSYSDRHEYDGSEHWDYHKIPTVKNIMSIKSAY